MEAKAALEARALELAEETARANARVATLEADVAEQTRVLELERRELEKERDAHGKTRDALRAFATAASGREAALTFSLDVQRQRARSASEENEKARAKAKRAASRVFVSRGTSTAGAEKEKDAREDEKKADEKKKKATPKTPSAAGSQPPREQREQREHERERERRENKKNETETGLISRLTLDLAGVRRAHAAATTTSASLRAALDAAETRCLRFAAEATRSRAETVSLCSRDAVRSAAMDALESLLEDARADAARFREAFEAAQADATRTRTRLEDAEKARDDARARYQREKQKRTEAETALAEARAVVRDALAREPARAGEAMGHASAREDALRARDEALERAAALETRLEETSSRAANFLRLKTAAESSFRVADERARDAEARATSSETRARSLESSLRLAEVTHQRRVAALETDAKETRAATEASRAELESAEKRADAAAVEKEETETSLRDALSECVALRERAAILTRERDRSMRDAEETRARLEETVKKTALAKSSREKKVAESRRAADAYAARALSLFFLSCAQRLRMEKDTASVRVELRDAKTRSLELSGDLREVKDDVTRLRSRNASLETTLRETRARSEQDAVRCASLIKKSEDAERVSRLRVAYARECERRLAVAEAEKIRLTRALDARGGR